jgi:DNA-binding Lrp family transcriptional regulator
MAKVWDCAHGLPGDSTIRARGEQIQDGFVKAAMLEERDLELVNGLQIAPRASWADAARILGSTPATLAARWERLREAGIVWTTAHPGGRMRGLLLSFVEVDCVPGRKPDVLRALCRDPRAVTIEESARGRDLLLTVMTPDLAALTRFVLDDLVRMPGVERHRTYFAKQLHVQGNAWRLGALAPDRRAAFDALALPAGDDGSPDPPQDAWPLIEGLSADGRRSAADLARITGRNPATVRRQLARLIASGLLSFRCELAQGHSRRPITCTYLARVPPTEHNRTVASLRTLPELRLCVSTTGETNMMFTVWTGSVSDLLQLEQRLGSHLPWLDIVDSAVILRTVKRMGWLLDAHGAATGEVVVPDALRPPA